MIHELVYMIIFQLNVTCLNHHIQSLLLQSYALVPIMPHRFLAQGTLILLLIQQLAVYGDNNTDTQYEQLHMEYGDRYPLQRMRDFTAATGKQY